MSIEIIVGLPHLNNGPILQRAKAMQRPTLISANCLSRWHTRNGLRDWGGWNTRRLSNAFGLYSLDLDSAGYVLASQYQGFPWSLAAYMTLAASYPFRRVASADYCCEHEIAQDRQEVLDRISRTIATNKECRQRAADLGILDRFMPVLQGRQPSDYERTADALSQSMTPGAIVGVGSMCRRPVHGPDGLIAVVAHLDQILPTGVRLHIFGAKGAALPFLLPFAHRVSSIDSQAWGTAARREAYRYRISKTDAFAADHMERWAIAQTKRLHDNPRYIPVQAPSTLPPSGCPTFEAAPKRPLEWEQAITLARGEIRDLIEAGELAHDEITAAWIETWAADLYEDAGQGK